MRGYEVYLVQHIVNMSIVALAMNPAIDKRATTIRRGHPASLVFLPQRHRDVEDVIFGHSLRLCVSAGDHSSSLYNKKLTHARP